MSGLQDQAMSPCFDRLSINVELHPEKLPMHLLRGLRGFGKKKAKGEKR